MRQLLNLKLTQPNPEFAQQLRRSTPGMAHFADTGPFGATCGGCSYLARFVRRAKHLDRCAKFTELMQGQVGDSVPRNTPACRYFLPRSS
jgi:hypothetical protein